MIHYSLKNLPKPIVTCFATLLELPAARSELLMDIELALLDDLDERDEPGIDPVPDCCIGILALFFQSRY